MKETKNNDINKQDDEQHPSVLDVSTVELSDHTISMRRVLEYCKTLLEKIEYGTIIKKRPHRHRILIPDAVRKARNIQQIRHSALQECYNNSSIDVIEDLSQISVHKFHQKYLIPNRPCLIRNNKNDGASHKISSF